MNMYYLMIEAIPKKDNPESKEFGGAYINCWVEALTTKEALNKAKEYIDEENWVFVKTKETRKVQREIYMDDLDVLECYDEACEYGISTIFYTWLIDEQD